MYLTHRYSSQNIKKIPPMIPSKYQGIYDSTHIEQYILDLIQANIFFLCYLFCRTVAAPRSYVNFRTAMDTSDYAYIWAFLIGMGVFSAICMVLLLVVIPKILPPSFLALALPPFFDHDNVEKLLSALESYPFGYAGKLWLSNPHHGTV